MGKDPAVLWYWSDFNDGTQDFTDEEVGAYVRLLGFQFSQGHLALERIKKRMNHNFERLWPIIKFKFIQDDDGLYFNMRMQAEIDKRIKYSESRRLNRMKKDINNTCETHEQDMGNEIEIKNKTINKTDELFNQFWEAYPKHKSKGDAERAWKKIKPKPTADFTNLVISKIQVLKQSAEWLKNNGEYIPYPASWLNAKGWLDEVSKDTASSGSDNGAQVSWDTVIRALEKYGRKAYEQEFPNKIKQTVQKIGGWSALANLTDYTLIKKKIDFMQAYRSEP